MKGTEVSRKSVAALVVVRIQNPLRFSPSNLKANEGIETAIRRLLRNTGSPKSFRVCDGTEMQHGL